MLQGKEGGHQACHFTTFLSSAHWTAATEEHTLRSGKSTLLLLLLFLIHIKGTFTDMTQVKQAKTTSHFLFRNFALIKKKKKQPTFPHPRTGNRWVT